MFMHHVWKILNNHPPNDVGIEFKVHQRHGIKAEIPPVNKRSQLSVRTDFDNTFRVKAAQLFNVLPLDVTTSPTCTQNAPRYVVGVT